MNRELDYIRSNGACRGETDLFYPISQSRKRSQSTGEKSRLTYDERVAAAKAICAICEVRIECLDYAVRNKEKSGIWGGKTEKER